MNIDAKQDVTVLLKKLNKGNKKSEVELMNLLYQELRGFAGNILKKENHTITFQATELVNEAYLRLFDSSSLDWNDRKHFLFTALVVMRKLLVDHARKKKAQRRIPKGVQSSIEEANLFADTLDLDVVRLNDALTDLEILDPKAAKIVELRFFGGLTEAEVALFLDVSRSSVTREWKAAKAWLLHQIKST